MVDVYIKLPICVLLMNTEYSFFWTLSINYTGFYLWGNRLYLDGLIIKMQNLFITFDSSRMKFFFILIELGYILFFHDGRYFDTNMMVTVYELMTIDQYIELIYDFRITFRPLPKYSEYILYPTFIGLSPNHMWLMGHGSLQTVSLLCFPNIPKTCSLYWFVKIIIIVVAGSSSFATGIPSGVYGNKIKITFQKDQNTIEIPN
ncbi:hypothetical protein ACJX0J_038352, partial [Zea mays]